MKLNKVRPTALGIGFLWAWVYCYFSTNLLFHSASEVGILIDPVWLVSAIIDVACLFVLGFIWHEGIHSSDKSIAWLGGMLTAAGTLLSALQGQFSSPLLEFTYLISGIFTGVGSALLCLIWAHLFSKITRAESEQAIPSSIAITVICAVVIPLLGFLPQDVRSALGSALVCILPLLCSLCADIELGLIEKRTEQRDARFEKVPANDSVLASEGESRGMLVRICISLLIFYFATSAALSIAPQTIYMVDSSMGDLQTISGSFLGLLFATAFVLYSRRTDFYSLFRWTLPLGIASISLAPWDNTFSAKISGSLFQALDVVLQSVAFLCALQLKREGFMKAIPAMALTQGMLQLGVLLGNILIIPLKQLAQQDSGNFAIAFVLIFLVSLIVLLVSPFRVNTSKTTQGIAHVTPATGEDPFLTASKELAVNYGLSPRETEIMGYLAQGRTQPFIRDQLVLSKNTVSSHAKHIYQKLGIHSKQELIDMVQASLTSSSK